MKKELLKRTIQNLKDEYTRNHEVMEEAENEQLLNDIAELEKMLNEYEQTDDYKIVVLNGDHWLDENGNKYKWIESNSLFFNLVDYNYYTTVDRLTDDKIAVELATATVIDEMYVDGHDKTILSERTIIDGKLVSEEIVSWYFGMPDPKLTNEYSKNRKLKAEYEI